ncbi:MAG: saccharopine dehydrogenase NADP-binding domain-containing protein [Actinomycetota bacterium]|nr:saccharopine dehydrogenase NADP-binding domain-containing protein [Actinomycetota bacterium]
MVLFGATGFVGRLTAGYLARHTPQGVRIGLGGRSEQRLSSLRSTLGGEASAWPLVVADSDDPGSLAAMAERTRVVATTVGPYRRHGLPLVEACAAAGTDYADLTGEVLFVRSSIDSAGAAAATTGSRIVHACGFDSIPSDLGVAMLHDAVRSDGAGDLEETTLVVLAMGGGVSGGTIATMKQTLEDVRTNPRLRAIMGDPYALSPERSAEPDLGPEPDLRSVRRDRELGMWVGPFVMAPFNARVVRRSNALQGWAYGRRFRYREVMGFGSGPDGPIRAGLFTSGVWALGAGLQFGPTRTLLDRVLPAPGQGPSERTRQRGFFRMGIHARTSAGAHYLGRVAAKGDPGYAATSVMLGESALCLAVDRDRLPAPGGVLTPATAMGPALIERLQAAGFTFEVQRQQT